MDKHLQSREHYEDRYDRMTVDSCRRREAFFMSADTVEDGDAYTKLKAGVGEVAWEIEKIYITLDWYNKRESTVSDWMHKDEGRDRMLSVAVPPKNIFCLTCSSRMYEESRSTWDRDGHEEVLFFMRCEAGHLPMQGVFEDGVELKIKEPLCPKCNAVIQVKRLASKKDVIKTKYTCPSCDYEEVDQYELSSKELDDPNYEADRARFCLSGESLRKAQDAKLNMEQISRLVEGWKHEEEHKAEYEAAAQLEKLTIPQVKERIAATIEGTAFMNLSFEKPLIERYVSIEFSVEELQTDNPRASTSNLQKRLKKALENTNWRLMTGGVDYRLGLLSGRIRAYETQEELLKLVS